MFPLQPHYSANIPKKERQTLDCRPLSLLDLDPGVLDHLAPARFLAAKIALQFFRRPRNHDETLVDAEPPEGLGLNRRCGGLVEAVDDILGRLGRREQRVPALPGIAGDAGFRPRRHFWECRRPLPRWPR